MWVNLFIEKIYNVAEKRRTRQKSFQPTKLKTFCWSRLQFSKSSLRRVLLLQWKEKKEREKKQIFFPPPETCYLLLFYFLYKQSERRWCEFDHQCCGEKEEEETDPTNKKWFLDTSSWRHKQKINLSSKPSSHFLNSLYLNLLTLADVVDVEKKSEGFVVVQVCSFGHAWLIVTGSICAAAAAAGINDFAANKTWWKVTRHANECK